MLRPIRDAMNGVFTSFDSLADELLKAAPAPDWPARRSLSVKIGELDRGVQTWWQRRPEKLKALLDLLQIDEADIGLHKGSSESNAYHFEDFPELPPLHLAREAALRIGRAVADDPLAYPTPLDEWLNNGPDGSQPRKPFSGITWLQMADGTGRGLLLAELAAKGRFDVIKVRRLEDVGTRLQTPKPLVIQLTEQPDTADLRPLLKCPSDASLLIVASIAFPRGDDRALEAMFSWEFLSTEKPERALMALSSPRSMMSTFVSPFTVTSLTWVLDKDWQARLLHWIEARLNQCQIDTLFSAQGLLNWIEAFDPQGHWIRTPEELMVLCRICHRRRDLDLPKASDRHLADALLQSVLSLKPAQVRLFRKLAENRWKALELPWQGALPEATWRALASGEETVTPEDLLAIAEAPNKEKRREMAMAVADKSSSGVVDALIEDGYLAHAGLARYDLRPPALANLIVRDWLLEQVMYCPLSDWSPAFFDEPRRRLLDATLDCLSTDELSALAERVCQEPEWAAGAVATSESLIYVMAPRLANGEPCTRSMRNCLQQVLCRLVRSPSLPRLDPWTRKLVSLNDIVSWLATCWAWSLTIPTKGIQISTEEAWQFPGWLREPPSTDGRRFSISELDLDTSHPSWRLLKKLCLQLTQRWERPPKSPPNFLMPALLAGAAMGRWTADPAWWEFVWINEKMERYFLSMIKPEGKKACINLWPSFLSFEQSRQRASVEHMGCLTSSTRQWILGTLNPSETLASLTKESIQYLLEHPATLPPALRIALLDQLPDDASEAYNLLKLCEGLDCDALVRWLQGATQHVAAERIWERPKDEVSPLLGRLARTHPEKLEALLNGCPEQHTEVALEAMERNPSLLSQEYCSQWIFPRLGNAKHLAQRMFKLIQPTGSQRSAELNFPISVIWDV